MGTNVTLQIEFGGDESVFLAAELDESKNGGKTTFMPGDIVHFRVWCSGVFNVSSTIGTVSKGGLGNEQQEEIISFIKGGPSGISKLATNIIDVFWYGNNLGTINVIAPTQVQASGNNENTIGICKLKYNTTYRECAFYSPSSSTPYSALIYIEAG